MWFVSNWESPTAGCILFQLLVPHICPISTQASQHRLHLIALNFLPLTPLLLLLQHPIPVVFPLLIPCSKHPTSRNTGSATSSASVTTTWSGTWPTPCLGAQSSPCPPPTWRPSRKPRSHQRMRVRGRSMFVCVKVYGGGATGPAAPAPSSKPHTQPIHACPTQAKPHAPRTAQATRCNVDHAPAMRAL